MRSFTIKIPTWGDAKSAAKAVNNALERRRARRAALDALIEQAVRNADKGDKS